MVWAALGCQNDTSQTSSSSDPVTNTPETPPLFTLLAPGQTGINFQNTLTEGLNTNILMYEYFYNGGGVATGDLNGDDLIDLYFSSNMSDNKLYLNQGEMKFQDITQTSGAGGRPGPWKTGVSMVDINGDKRLDIYLCYSGSMPEPKRANQLFINEGNDAEGIPQFREAAAEYGLASMAFSNQTYFFDYDRDGDLDLILLNHNPKSLPVLNEAQTREFLQVDDPLRGVRLFRQDKGRFEDVTERVGISGSALSYGLGVGISDVNDDGWPDFYVSNDYTVPDYLYINNRNGTFSNELNESLSHNSHFSMGNDVADINNDGLSDIFTLDMLPEDNYRQKLLMAPDNYAKFDLNLRSGFHYQYMRNMLQLNNGDGTYSEIGQLAGVSNTDWSWSALLADYDNDGWKDLMITNGYYRDYTNLDFIAYMDDFVKQRGRLMRQDVLEIISHMPASNVVNYIFSNQQGKGFQNETRDWGLYRPSNSNGAAYADLDNDGDLDLIVNNVNQAAFIYQNQARQLGSDHYLQVKLEGEGLNTQGLGAKLTLYSGGQQQRLEQVLSRGYLSSVSPVLHFGLGERTIIDSLSITWPSSKHQTLTGIPVDTLLVLAETEADRKPPKAIPTKSYFRPVQPPVAYQQPKQDISDFDRQLLLNSEFSHSGPLMIKGDVDGDNLEDIFIGKAIGESSMLLSQTSSGNFKPVPNFELRDDEDLVDADAAFFDANGDGALDLYVAAGGYHDFAPQDARLQDQLYLNDGQGKLSPSKDALPEMRVSKGCVAINDVNGDGYEDVFVGGRVIPGRYPEMPSSYLLINDGNGKFSDETNSLAPELSRLGMVTDAVWVDLNQDQQKELVVVGEWMPVSVYGIKNGKLENHTDKYFEKPYKGWWNSLTVADVNGDQRPDLLLGNVGTNLQFRANDEQPAEMYFADFDDNGAVDPIFCTYIQGKSYPYVTRDELLKQLVGFRSRFTSYESYANVSIWDLFPAEEVRAAGHLAANHLETSLFLNQPGGKMKLVELPVQAQYAPVYTINTLDFDEDGHQDLLLCGNNSYSKLRLGKLCANFGMLFRGDGTGNFEYVEQRESGLKLWGDVRSVVELNGKWLFGINEGEVVAYELKKRE